MSDLHEQQPGVCFYCGDPAVKTIRLTEKTVLNPFGNPVYIGLCFKHWLGVSPGDKVVVVSP